MRAACRSPPFEANDATGPYYYKFAMCSTFKWVLAAATLAAVDAGELTLAREVVFGEKDLLEYAPTTRAHVAAGRLRVEALAAAIVINSDNTAPWSNG